MQLYFPPGEITFKDPKSYISTAAQGATGTSIGESMLQDDGVTIQISKNAQVSWICFLVLFFYGFYRGKITIKQPPFKFKGEYVWFTFSIRIEVSANPR